MSLDGMDALAASYMRVQKKMEGDVAREAAKAAGKQLAEVMGENAPLRTGELSEDMVVSPVQKGEGGVYVDVGPGKESFYGHMQEFGTAHHGAQPFMRPAMEDPSVARAAEEGAKKGADKLW